MCELGNTWSVKGGKALCTCCNAISRDSSLASHIILNATTAEINMQNQPATMANIMNHYESLWIIINQVLCHTVSIMINQVLWHTLSITKKHHHKTLRKKKTQAIGRGKILQPDNCLNSSKTTFPPNHLRVEPKPLSVSRPVFPAVISQRLSGTEVEKTPRLHSSGSPAKAGTHLQSAQEVCVRLGGRHSRLKEL